MSNYEQGEVRQRNTKKIETPLLDNGVLQQRIKKPRPSLTSRIISAIKWTAIAFVISWYFESLQGINEVLEKDTWKRKIFYTSLIALLNTFLIFIYLQYYIPFTKRVPSPNYPSWKTDDTLKKFVPISTFLGLIGIIGLLVSFWSVFGFFGTPLVVFSILTSIVNILNIL